MTLTSTSKKATVIVAGILTVASLTAIAISKNQGNDESTTNRTAAIVTAASDQSNQADTLTAPPAKVSTQKEVSTGSAKPEQDKVNISLANNSSADQQVSAPLNLEQQRAVSSELKAATIEASGGLHLGPITGCLDQMRAFACPIVSAIPVVKDLAGIISLELGISCPAGA